MADSKVSALGSGAPVVQGDRFYIAKSPFGATDSKRVTTQDLFNGINVLAAASVLVPADKLAAYNAAAVTGTVQQVLDAIDGLAAAGALAGTDTLAVIQAAAAKEATITQLMTFIQNNQTTMLNLSGSAFKIVGGSASATTNGTNLIADYATAAASTPHGAALSSSNRFTLFLLPGIFDLGAATLAMNTQFVDIVGLGSRPINGTMDDSTFGAGGCVVTSSGTAINKTADNAHLMNFACVTTANATATPALQTTGSFGNEIFAFMYFHGAGGANSRGMALDKTWAGYYTNCLCQTEGFGVSASATGTFVRCRCGPNSFGAAAIASGTFLFCEASSGSFAGLGGGVASGFFYFCCSTPDFGGSAALMFGDTSASGTFLFCRTSGTGFGQNGTATGTFIGCVCNVGFGGGVNTPLCINCVCTAVGFSGTANGTYINCFSGGTAGGFGASFVTSTGTFINCVSNADQGFSYRGTAGGTYINCRSGNGSFGGSGAGIAGGSATGTFRNCVAGNLSFGGTTGAAGGTVSGSFFNCVAGTNSFGGTDAAGTPGTMSGVMVNCQMAGEYRINLTGKIEGSRIEAVAANTSAFILVSTSTGAIYNCTLIGTGTGLSLDVVSGTPTVKAAHCRLNKGISGSITNAIGTPYIVDDADII